MLKYTVHALTPPPQKTMYFNVYINLNIIVPGISYIICDLCVWIYDVHTNEPVDT